MADIVHLSSEAGLTTQSAAAVKDGVVDNDLHAGFISKQHNSRPLETNHDDMPPSPKAQLPDDVLENLDVDKNPLEESTEPSLNAEAGLTETAAAVARRGVVDNQLHAGFISKQEGIQGAQ